MTQITCQYLVLYSELKVTKCYFEDGYLDTSVYLWEELLSGCNIPGPAIIIDKNRQDFFFPKFSFFSTLNALYTSVSVLA